MDPTLARSMRIYLASLDRDHAPADPDDAGRPGTSCTCGDLQPDGRDRHLLEVITEHFAERALEPHVVHVKGAIEHEKPYQRNDVDGRPAKDEHGKPVMVSGRRYVGPEHCPDCRHGLTGRGEDLVCSRLSPAIELVGCHEGCIVACGSEA